MAPVSIQGNPDIQLVGAVAACAHSCVRYNASMSSRPWLLSIFCALAFSGGTVPALADSLPTAGTYFGLLEGDRMKRPATSAPRCSKSGNVQSQCSSATRRCVVGVWPIRFRNIRAKPGGDADMGVELRTCGTRRTPRSWHRTDDGEWSPWRRARPQPGPRRRATFDRFTFELRNQWPRLRDH